MQDLVDPREERKAATDDNGVHSEASQHLRWTCGAVGLVAGPAEVVSRYEFDGPACFSISFYDFFREIALMISKIGRAHV